MSSFAFVIITLLLSAFAADTCPSLNTFNFLNEDADRTAVLDCMRAIHPYAEADAKSLVDALTLAQQSYAFTADLRAPEHPGMAVQDVADLRVDLVAEHQAMLTKDYPSSFEMYVDAQQIWARARDAHTAFHAPPCYQYTIPYQPVSLCAFLKDDGKVGIRSCKYQAELSFKILKKLGVAATDVFDKEIAKINGKDAYAFAREWADKRFMLGRDPAQRLEAWLDYGANYPSWHSLFTDKLTIPDWHNPADESAVFEFEFEYADGFVLKAPVVAYMPPQLQYSSNSAIYTPTYANFIASKACPHTRTQSLVAAVPAGEPAVSPLVSLVQSQQQLLDADGKQATAQATAQVAATTPRLASALPVVASKIEQEVALWEQAQSHNAEYQVHKARIEAEIAAGGQYVNLSIEDGVCVMQIATYSPSNVQAWIAQLYNTMFTASQRHCGIKGGRELVIDVRSNPGGAVVLLDLFFGVMFPHYTPHHTTVQMANAGDHSGVVDDAMTLFNADHDPVREIGSFHPHPACDNRATANCPAWWKKAETATVRHMGGQDYTYSAAVTSSPLFWEKPNKFSSLKDWVDNGNGGSVLGTDNAAWDVLAEEFDFHWGAIPEMTTWAAGPVTASCGGHTVTRAIAYHLGAVTSTGGAPEVEHWGRMMAGRVPGGNVLASDSFTAKFNPLWPHTGAKVSFTTHASLPYTQDTVHQPHATQTTPMEFVELPPHFNTPVWDQSNIRDTAEGRKRLVAALRQPGQPLATCTPNERNWDKKCPRTEGVAVAGRLCNAKTGAYDGPCGPALCQFGWELVNGTCVDNNVHVVSLPTFPAVHYFFHPWGAVPLWVPIVSAISGVLLIAIVVFICVRCRRSRPKSGYDLMSETKI